jgi:hypothetical protein
MSALKGVVMAGNVPRNSMDRELLMESPLENE